MSKEKKLILSSSVLMIIYLIIDIMYMIKTNNFITSNFSLNIFNITMSILCILGIISFIYISLSKNDLKEYRGILITFSIIFFINNIISGILGFIALSKIEKKKRELPTLEIQYNYKWYIYILVLIISLVIMFFLSNLFSNNIELFISYLVILLMVLFIFRKDLKRDITFFKKYFREYNSYVLKTYIKSLVVLFVLSLSIKIYTGIENATNQETLNVLFKESPIIVCLLSMVYAPVAEELLFRGIFRKIINNKYLFIILSGFLFGIAHVIDDFKSIEELLYILVYSSLGCFLASIYYKTNNLCANIYFHFIQNTISVIALIIVTYFLPNII